MANRKRTSKLYQFSTRFDVIRNYVESVTGEQIENPHTRKHETIMAMVIFMMLAKRFCDAEDVTIGEYLGRSRVNVYQHLSKNRDLAKRKYPNIYENFNPMILHESEALATEMFSRTLHMMKYLREAFDKDMVDLSLMKDNAEEEVLHKIGELALPEKAFEIIRLLKGLDENQYDALIDRVPPIIKMSKQVENNKPVAEKVIE